MAKITLEDIMNLEGNKVPTDVKSYSTFVYSYPKAGKALDNNTVIPTPEGNKKVSEIKTGDMLFDRKGNPTKVTGVFPQGVLKAYKVSLNDGTSFIVNGEHIIPYITSKGNINSKTLNEMMKDYKKEREDVFGDGRTSNSHKYRVPKSDAVHYEKKDLILHPYALGVLIGDGSLTVRDLTVSSSEIDVIERFMECAGLEEYSKSKYNYNFTFQKRYNGNRPKKIKNIIEKLGLNVKSVDRFIPKEYLTSSIKQRKDLLAGLFDTDGHVSINKTGSRKYSFSTNSEQLAKDVKELALSLGYGISMKSYTRKDNLHENMEHCVLIFTKDNISKSNKHLQKLESQTDWYESKKEQYSKIVNIEEVEEREMTCFSVDNEEKLFLINDYIVTHNTTFINDLYGEKVLFLATERRHDAIAGAHVINIDSWAEFLQVMKLLKKPELQDKYDAICIDTVGRLENYCEKYVLANLGIDDLSDAAWGKGFSTYNKELEHGLSLIEKSGFVPVFITHAKQENKKVLLSEASKEEKEIENAQVTRDGGKEYVEYQKTTPDIKNKFFNMINRIADNILFLDLTVDSKGVEHRKIFYRDSLEHLAGATFRNMPEYTELSPKAYQETVEKAIESEGKEHTEDTSRQQSHGADYNFDSLMSEVADLGKQLQNDGKADERNKVISEVLGNGRKVKDLDESQAEVLAVLVDKLKEIA